MTERTVFCADIHLMPDKPEKTGLFLRFLEETAGAARTLYLLGDVFDVWLGWKHLRIGEYGDVVAGLKRVAESTTRVVFVPGNRDFLIGGAFEKATGVEIMYYGGDIYLDGLKVHISHGDYLCPQDSTSRRFAAVVRGTIGRRTIQPLFKILPVRTAYNLARGYSEHSTRVKKHKSSQAFDISPDALKSVFLRGVDVVVCGHLHRALKRRCRLGGKEKTLYVLSDWDTSTSYLEHTSAGFAMKKFE